jgi:hypothetical protein
MPRFKYSDVNLNTPPVGVYLAQVVNAKKTRSKAENDQIVLTLRTIPDGYTLWYHLVFNGTRQSDGIVTQFCKHCEGPLEFPEDPREDFSLTPVDCMFRVVYVDVIHESRDGSDSPAAKIKYAGILSRATALGRVPELANVRLPANVPAAQKLANFSKDNGLPNDEDDIPF